MDRDDHRRYFIVGSVIMEIVTPVFRQRLEKDYKSKRFECLQDFINSKPVIHILFHLRHRNIKCCVDSTNCRNRGTLPLNYSQWDLLYTENPGPPKHHCHCLYTTNNVKLDDLDITLASLILLNCCNLTPNEETLIKELRKFKNNYLSHNTKGAITEKEFRTLWKDLTTCVLQLDPSKQDDIIRIQNRPLDDLLCNKYFVCLLDIHKKLEEIDTRIQNIGATTADIHSTSTEILSTMNINNAGLKAEIMAKLEEVLQQLIKNQTNKQVDQPNKPYILGQSIFILHHEINLTLEVGDDLVGYVSDMVMMDDGRLVMCLPWQHRLLICNTDGSQADSIHVQGGPGSVTAVNNSTVAVTLYGSKCIEMFDINNKLKLKSISLPGMLYLIGITTINNKLVVGGVNRLLIIDHQTGEVVQTIQTDRHPGRLQGSGDRIFYCDTNNNLYWYSYTDYRHHTLTLPSRSSRMTTLQDGSLYVVCDDRSVQHVSSDGKQYKTVKNKGLKSILFDGSLYYNCKQRKLVTGRSISNIKIFHEK
ncbi:uncharacterized protein LOC127726383 [Mytilus californianus]|uniref:uncharacterized protein LOC127726383 n=1 Tax=Mytilus californianus TaxID=6549 RepID=UPI0022462FC7|nr:uncharacterized protein LOC127726383 [Mytilus californianus]XP_052089732.1 uncharacterized protein LOC127726383 [Mytilus californianus]XP_052089733.1 uncharacterized protein LOC127726383 [Mytilus californianus]